MKVKSFNIYEIIYLSFALDSALKIGLGGFRVHLGILCILFLSVIGFVQNPRFLHFPDFIRKNWSIFPFVIYLFLQVVLNDSYIGVAVTILYFFLSIWIFYFLYRKESIISDQAILLFQWILIGTGLFQSLLYHFFGYQLTFFNADHYAVEASYATRLRGFFLEPNWFSIILTFNTLLLILRTEKGLLKRKGLLAFTLLSFFLNGSYGFVGVVILGYFLRVLMDLPKVSIKKMSVIFILIFIAGGLVLSRNIYKQKIKGATSSSGISLNYGSRLGPAIRTVLFMSTQDRKKNCFGFGVGSWPYIGIDENKLGYVGFANSKGGEIVIKPGQRDSAEFHVFLLEIGYLGIFLFLFDYAYNYWKFRKLNFIYSIASACLLAAFFVYPMFKFLMYLVPFYLIRAYAVKNSIYKKMGNEIYYGHSSKGLR